MQQLDLTAIGDSPTELLESIILVEELIPENTAFLNEVCNRLFNKSTSSIVNGNMCYEEDHGSIINWCIRNIKYKIKQHDKPIIIVTIDMITEKNKLIFDQLAKEHGRKLFIY